MSTLASPSREPFDSQPHLHRGMAESFGADPERYDRARPRYPTELVERVAADAGPDLLDVGCGTGIVARQFQAAGCRVLGVEVDARMAEWARGSGVECEVASFEGWEPAGRTFDVVAAGTTWHWVDPERGTAQASRVLRPSGLLALFWNVVIPPPELATAFSEVYRRVVPELPVYRGGTAGVDADGYEPILAKADNAIRQSGSFGEPERWRFDSPIRYTRDQWLDAVPTFGGHSRFAPARLTELLAGLGDAITEAGGAFDANAATVAVVARRCRERCDAD